MFWHREHLELFVAILIETFLFRVNHFPYLILLGFFFFDLLCRGSHFILFLQKLCTHLYPLHNYYVCISRVWFKFVLATAVVTVNIFVAIIMYLRHRPKCNRWSHLDRVVCSRQRGRLGRIDIDSDQWNKTIVPWFSQIWPIFSNYCYWTRPRGLYAHSARYFLQLWGFGQYCKSSPASLRVHCRPFPNEHLLRGHFFNIGCEGFYFWGLMIS